MTPEAGTKLLLGDMTSIVVQRVNALYRVLCYMSFITPTRFPTPVYLQYSSLNNGRSTPSPVVDLIDGVLHEYPPGVAFSIQFVIKGLTA